MKRKASLIFFILFILFVLFSSYYLENTESNSYVSYGEILFEHNCTQCHSRNLKNPATGPALGHVTKHRNQQYLRNVTRNFHKEIESNNELAMCVFRQWGTIMSQFEHLTILQIDSIYRFIEEESIRQNIGLDDVKYLQSCEKINFEYSFYDEKGREIKELPYDTVRIKKQIDRIKFEDLYFNETLYNYKDSIPTKLVKLENFEVQSQLPKNTLVKGFLVFEDIGFTESLSYYNKNFYYSYLNSKNSTQIYENENFKIILIEESISDKIYFGFKKVKRSELNRVHAIHIQKEEKLTIKQLLKE